MSAYPKITASEVQACYDAFDKGKDNKITKEQTQSCIRALGYNPREKEIEDYLKDAGEDIDFGTFKGLYDRNPFQRPDQQTDECLQAFKLLDGENDGTINESELRQMLSTIGDILSHDEVNVIMEDIGVDQQGRVHYEEFITLLATGCGELLTR